MWEHNKSIWCKTSRLFISLMSVWSSYLGFLDFLKVISWYVLTFKTFLLYLNCDCLCKMKHISNTSVISINLLEISMYVTISFQLVGTLLTYAIIMFQFSSSGNLGKENYLTINGTNASSFVWENVSLCPCGMPNFLCFQKRLYVYDIGLHVY